MLPSIAVHLDTDGACRQRIRIAVRLALRYKARLVGIYANLQGPRSYSEDKSTPIVISAVMHAQRAESLRAVETLFHRELSNKQVQASLRAPVGSPESALCTQARYSDLLIVSQPTRDNSARFDPIIAAVLLNAGRPVLMVPAGTRISGQIKRALCAWNAGREAARALADAGPLLALAKELFILEVGAPVHSTRQFDGNSDELTLYCKEHGYPTPPKMVHRIASFSVAHTILEAAADLSCDLIVMGAYGHSRGIRAVLGDTTSAIVAKTTVPVLFSH